MNQNLMFHVFETMTSKTTTKLMGLNELFEKIKKGDNYKPFIEAIRVSGKDSVMYKNVKENRECVVWNATFNGGKTEKDITAMTGYIYMDKDNLSEKEIKHYKELLMTYNYVVAVWKSIGGKGIGCLMYCEQTNQANYKGIWNQIDDTIGIEFDKYTNSTNKLNFISYDAEICINEDVQSFEYKAANNSNVSTSENITVPVYYFQPNKPRGENLAANYDNNNYLNKLNSNQAEHSYKSTVSFNTKFDQDIFEGQQYKYFEDSIDYLTINSFCKIKEGFRNRRMVAITSTFLELNPDVDKPLLLYYIHYINSCKCLPPLPAKEVNSIFNYCYQKKTENLLYAKPKKRCLIFAEDCTLSKKEKLKVSGEAGRKKKVQYSSEAIQRAIYKVLESKKLVTIKDLESEAKRGRKTIKKYYPNIQSLIDEHNNSLTENIGIPLSNS